MITIIVSITLLSVELNREHTSQHQDGGIYSVNIALNARKIGGNEIGFTGGKF